MNNLDSLTLQNKGNKKSQISNAGKVCVECEWYESPIRGL